MVVANTEDHRTPSGPDLVRMLQHSLEPDLVAYLVPEVDPAELRGWKFRDRQTQRAVKHRLQEVLDVFRRLEARDGPALARNWFLATNPRLRGRAPAEVIREGDVSWAKAAAIDYLERD
ncbi:MAG: hypothetical protein ACRD12_11385 [Acidimicrobiales bacterium]